MEKINVDDKITLAYCWHNSHYFYPDKENTPILVFLHEGLGSIAQWKDFPKLVSDSMHLPALVYERYGYGHSTSFFDVRETNYLHKEADYFLPRLLQKLHLQNNPIILIGHSDGASIALIYAALFPENVLAVISIAAHVFVEDISLDGIRTAKQFFLKDNMLKEKLKKYHFDHVESTFLAWTDTWLKPEFKHWNIFDLLPKINAPVLAVQGDKDEYGTEKQLNYIVKDNHHPLTKKVLLPNCKHSPHIQAKELLLKETTDFLNKILQKHLT
jgi:pimeloyl-ACP methyl ester carboxylesterase